MLAAFSFLMGPDSSVGPRFEPWCQAATDSSLAEKPFLRPFLACGGLRFPVSAQRPKIDIGVRANLAGGTDSRPSVLLMKPLALTMAIVEFRDRPKK